MQELLNYDTPHVIIINNVMLVLAILKDDFSKLDRPRLMIFFFLCVCVKRKMEGSLVA